MDRVQLSWIMAAVLLFDVGYRLGQRSCTTTPASPTAASNPVTDEPTEPREPREPLPALVRQWECQQQIQDSEPSILDSSLDSRNLSSYRPRSRVHLITYAQGERFEASGTTLVRTALKLNFVDSATMWTYKDIIFFAPENVKIWNFVQTVGLARRPACMAHKPRMMNFFLNNEYHASDKYKTRESSEQHAAPPVIEEGDWVFWMDSSQYYPNGLNESGNVREFAHTLEARGIDAYVGLPCGMNMKSPINLQYGNSIVGLPVFEAMNADYPKYWNAPHYQNNMIGFRANNKTRAFMAEWWWYNSDMYVAASSHTNDQAIFSILVTKYGYRTMMGPEKSAPAQRRDPNTIIPLLLNDKTRRFYTGDEIQQADLLRYAPIWRKKSIVRKKPVDRWRPKDPPTVK